MGPLSLPLPLSRVCRPRDRGEEDKERSVVAGRFPPSVLHFVPCTRPREEVQPGPRWAIRQLLFVESFTFFSLCISLPLSGASSTPKATRKRLVRPNAVVLSPSPHHSCFLESPLRSVSFRSRAWTQPGGRCGRRPEHAACHAVPPPQLPAPETT